MGQLRPWVWRTRFQFYEPIQVSDTEWFLAGYTIRFYGSLLGASHVLLIDDPHLKHLMFHSIDEIVNFIGNLYVDIALAVEEIEHEKNK